MEKYVAAVQMDCVTGAVEENTIHIIQILKRMKRENEAVTLIVFPEMILYGYEKLEKISTDCSQIQLERNLKKIAETCEKLKVNAVVGAPYFGEAGIENALYFLDTNGKVQHVYSKMHLIEEEKNIFQPGKACKICETDVGKLGFLVCWDSAFPEMAEKYALEGAELFIISAAWENPYERQWELAVCGSSFSGDVPAIAANRIGKDGNVEFAGHAMITDCLGNVLEEAKSSQESYVIAELTKITNKEKRQGFGTQIKEKSVLI